MGENQSQKRDAAALLEAGIAELRQQQSSPTAKIFLGAAETMFKDAGDTFNADVARQWLDTADA